MSLVFLVSIVDLVAENVIAKILCLWRPEEVGEYMFYTRDVWEAEIGKKRNILAQTNENSSMS